MKRTLLPLLAIALMLGPGSVWIFMNQTVWPWDHAHYADETVRLYGTLAETPGAWPKAMLAAVRFKAPGTTWFGQFFVPLGQVLGSIEVGLLISILLCQAATLWVIHLLGRRLAPGSAMVPLLGVVFAGAAPLFAGTGQQYMTEPLQTLAVAGVFLVACHASSLAKTSLACCMILAGCVAMLAKFTSPLYCILPAAVAAACLLRPRSVAPNPAPARRRILAVMSVALLGLTAAWYARNLRHVLGHVRGAMSAEVALDYGTANTLGQKLMTWLAMLQRSFALPWVLWVTTAVLVIFGLVRWYRSPAPERDPRVAGSAAWVPWAALGQVVIVILAFSLSLQEGERYLIPLLPALAVLLMVAVTWTRTWIVPAVLLLCFGAQHVLVAGHTLGLAPRPEVSQLAVAAADRSDQVRTVERVIAATCAPGNELRHNIVGVEFPWLNLNSLSFYCGKSWLTTGRRCHYRSLGYGASDLDAAWKRMEDLNPAFVISQREEDQAPEPAFLNRLSVPFLRRVQASADFSMIDADFGLGVVVFRRVRNGK